MASSCPKCRQTIDDDVICCAEVRASWKCTSCGKLSSGFVVPYGRCFLCGGENEVVEGYSGDDAVAAAVVREAMQFELEMYHFYRLALQRSGDEQQRAVVEDLLAKEEEHLSELSDKYHVHPEGDLRSQSENFDRELAAWLFEGIQFDETSHVAALYDKAIALEKRTRDHFLARAAALPDGKEREIYRELAAEEEEHVALLETERRQLAEG